jgi:hypothetical protein
MPCSTYNTPFHCTPSRPAHLERVILRRDLLDKVVSEDGDLLHNVLADARYLGEEEEGEETGYTAEAASESTAGICQFRVAPGVGS